MMYGQFNTDTAALKKRLTANTRLAAVDLQSWVFSKITLHDRMRVLDIGCGTGNYLAHIKSQVLEPYLVGLDQSPAAIEAVQAKGIEGRCCSFDDPITGQFDLILSVYAIYYSKDMPALIQRLRANLAPGGMMFLVGPGAGTNQELVKDLELPWSIPDFMPVEGEALRLNNTVTFPDKDALLGWWTNHNSFDPTKLSRVDTFEFPYTMTKNVLGVIIRD